MATGADTQASPIAEAPSPAPKESRGWLWSLLIGLLILGLISTVPLLGDASALHTWTLIVMFIVLAQSWNFIGGFAGYAAFGNVAFFGIGAYTTGLMLLAHHPFWSGLVLGALVAGLFAFLLGLPVLRLKGHYFAIITHRREFAQGLSDAKRSDSEVMPLQTQHRQSEQEGEEAGHQRAQHKPRPEGVMGEQHKAGCVRSNTKKRDIAERGIAGEAADKVPALRQHDKHDDKRPCMQS